MLRQRRARAGASRRDARRRPAGPTECAERAKWGSPKGWTALRRTNGLRSLRDRFAGLPDCRRDQGKKHRPAAKTNPNPDEGPSSLASRPPARSARHAVPCRERLVLSEACALWGFWRCPAGAGRPGPEPAPAHRLAEALTAAPRPDRSSRAAARADGPPEMDRPLGIEEAHGPMTARAAADAEVRSGARTGDDRSPSVREPETERSACTGVPGGYARRRPSRRILSPGLSETAPISGRSMDYPGIYPLSRQDGPELAAISRTPPTGHC